MPIQKITDTLAARVPFANEGRKIYWDTILKGFGLRVGRKRKTWIVMTRVGRKQINRKIGRYPAVSLKDARIEAGKLIADADAGIDRREQLQKEAEEKAEKVRQEQDRLVIDDLVEEFLEKHAKAKTKARSYEETKRLFDLHVLPRWKGRYVDTIRKRDVIRLLDDIRVGKGRARGGPTASNRTMAALSKMFNWTIARDLVELSPVAGIERPHKEHHRERVLSDAEIVALWDACDELSQPFGSFYKILLLTAQRRGEVAAMKWSDIVDDVWTLPREFVKGDRTHEVPLSPLAIEILETMPHVGDHVFTTGNRRGRGAEDDSADTPANVVPISGFSKAKRALDEQIDEAMAEAKGNGEDVAGLFTEPWRVHDLRRTAGTKMASLGVDPFVISRVLNHAEGGVTHIYRRYGFLDQKRHALNLWAQNIIDLTRPDDADDKVVPISEAK